MEPGIRKARLGKTPDRPGTRVKTQNQVRACVLYGAEIMVGVVRKVVGVKLQRVDLAKQLGRVSK